uniref:Uncharacterized protein n=1 Tax=Anguilla anguilla TaxID=7936 RepID=A0A0E9PEL3_ANGAN
MRLKGKVCTTDNVPDELLSQLP